MRVRSIELWRMLFTVSIVLCHACLLPWNMREGKQLLSVTTYAVEFFFVLSGFLMARTVHSLNEKKENVTQLGSETFSFVIKKMKPIFPIYVFAAILELVISGILRSVAVENLQYRIWDILFLRASGLGSNEPSAVGGSWYLSAMFLAMWIIYPLLQKFTDVFCNVIAPISAILIFGWFENTYGTINFALYMENGICLGLLRAISVICAGVFAYSLCEKLKKRTANISASTVITLVELLSIISVFILLFYTKRSRNDFLIILLLCIGIIAAFSGKSYLNVWLSKLSAKWTAWIPEYSLCLYLNHYVWILTLRDWKLAIPFWHEVCIYLVLSLLSSLACYFTIKGFRLSYARIKQKLITHDNI